MLKGHCIAGHLINVNYMDPNSIRQGVNTAGAMKNTNSMIGSSAAGTGASSDHINQITTQSPSASTCLSFGQ